MKPAVPDPSSDAHPHDGRHPAAGPGVPPAPATAGAAVPRDYRGKVVLVTGAGGGLGAALCRRFAQAGARVAGMDIDASALQALQAGWPGARDEHWLALGGPTRGDITDPAACAAAVQTVAARWGGVDLLINNAGLAHRSLLQDTQLAVIQRVMAVNFFGALNMTHAALPALRARRGQVAAISSVAGFAPLYGRTGYAASKHALHGLFESLRAELSPQGVGVLLACPSFIATGIGAAALDGAGRPVRRARIATGGESPPDAIAALIFEALRRNQRLLLPDSTSRLAWWVSKLAPAWYARSMTRRVRAEFDT